MLFVYSLECPAMVLDQIWAGRSVAGLARELEMHESALHRWKRQGRTELGLVSGVSLCEGAQLKAAWRRIRGVGGRVGGGEAGVGTAVWTHTWCRYAGHRLRGLHSTIGVVPPIEHQQANTPDPQNQFSTIRGEPQRAGKPSIPTA